MRRTMQIVATLDMSSIRDVCILLVCSGKPDEEEHYNYAAADHDREHGGHAQSIYSTTSFFKLIS